MATDVLRQFFAEASGAMDQLSVQVHALAERFRRHEMGDAHSGLAAVTNELRQFVLMVDVLCGPLAIDPERLRVGGRSLDEQMTTLARHLEALIDAQGHEDWLTVADILELDLDPLLTGWGPRLRELGAEACAA